MPTFRYTDPKHTYHRIRIDARTAVEVVGDGDRTEEGRYADRWFGRE